MSLYLQLAIDLLQVTVLGNHSFIVDKLDDDT